MKMTDTAICEKLASIIHDETQGSQFPHRRNNNTADLTKMNATTAVLAVNGRLIFGISWHCKRHRPVAVIG